MEPMFADPPRNELERLTGQSELQMQVADGELVGQRYRIVRHLGSGGMGEVYEVQHTTLGRHFAVKLLKQSLAAQSALLSRFRTEVKSMARLHSDHVVQVFDSGQLANGSPYFAMELLKGADLKTILEQVGSLAPHRAVRLMLNACWGLRTVHEAGLVHRDIKPGNLFVTRTDSGGERCVILDFGVTKTDETTHTHQGQLVGTLRYMAPEQLESGSVDARTDLYSLGVVLYQCLAGRPPHSEDTIERLVYSIMNKDPVPLAKLCPGIPSELSSLVQRSVARRAADRFADADSMARALAQLDAHLTRAARLADTSSASLALNPSSRQHSGWRRPSAVALALLGVATAAFVAGRHLALGHGTSPAGAPRAAVCSTSDQAFSLASSTPATQAAVLPQGGPVPTASARPASNAPSRRSPALRQAAPKLRIDPSNPY